MQKCLRARVRKDEDRVRSGFSDYIPVIFMPVFGIFIISRNEIMDVRLWTQFGTLIAGAGVTRLFVFLVLSQQQDCATRSYFEFVTSICLTAGGLILWTSTEEVLTRLATTGITTGLISGILITVSTVSAACTVTWLLVLQSLASKMQT